jgi:hypothetical protein
MDVLQICHKDAKERLQRRSIPLIRHPLEKAPRKCYRRIIEVLQRCYRDVTKMLPAW